MKIRGAVKETTFNKGYMSFKTRCPICQDSFMMGHTWERWEFVAFCVDGCFEYHGPPEGK